MKKIDKCLREKLCCPACKGELKYEKKSFLCVIWRKKFPIVSGIPELVYYHDEGGEQRNLNSTQAQYEREVHDKEAKIYEDRVVKVFGDKTELIATD